MTKREHIENLTQEILNTILSGSGLSIYDIEYIKEAGEYYLRVYIDKLGGVSINDCEYVSKALSPLLDEIDEASPVFDEAYHLEVSSPGLLRALKKDKHIAASIGKLIDITTYVPMELIENDKGQLIATVAVKTKTEKGAGKKQRAAKIKNTCKKEFTYELAGFDGEKILAKTAEDRDIVFFRKDITGLKLSFIG